MQNKSKTKESNPEESVSPDALSRKSSTKVQKKASASVEPKKLISLVRAPVDKLGN